MKNRSREQHNRDIADHFAGFTDYWKDIYASPVEPHDFFHHESAKKRLQAVLGFVDAFAQGRTLRILDAGCGAGVIMEALCRSGHIVWGIDVSPDMVSKTAETLGRRFPGKATVQTGSVEDLDFPDQSFDLCICIGVLQYLAGDEQCLSELERVTKPGGRVIISLPNYTRLTTLFDPYYYLYRAPLFIFYKLFPQRRESIGLSSEDISKNLSFRNRRYFYGQLNGLYRKCGLTVAGMAPIGYGPLTIWTREYLPRPLTLWLSRHVERIASLRALTFLKAIAERWVIALEKSYEHKERANG